MDVQTFNEKFGLSVRTCFTQSPLETITTSGETRTVAIDTLSHITSMSTLFLAFIAILSVATSYHNPKIIPVIRFHILQMVRYCKPNFFLRASNFRKICVKIVGANTYRSHHSFNIFCILKFKYFTKVRYHQTVYLLQLRNNVVAKISLFTVKQKCMT